ncbi:MAG: protein kinase [Candidatus Hydrogenedentes bacterium]|nr:protein kinase [Candidatus Hydrogenedentota bacterium]
MNGAVFDDNAVTYVSLRAEITLGGRFRLVRRVGRGGMGEVWLAEDSELDNRPVALKMLKPEFSDDEGALRDLKRELVLARELSHANIVRVHDLHRHGELHFISMEYVPGMSLQARLSGRGKRPFALNEVLPWARHVADALDYAHSRKVLHRDVKPGNMLLAADGTTKLVDFGIARVIHDTETHRTGHATTGTLAYMSPQQLLNEKRHRNDQRNDVYSFAASLYELLNGEPPFLGGDMSLQILRKEPELIPGVPEYVNAALLAGLAKDIECRPTNCATLLHEFSGAAAEALLREETARRTREEEERRRAEEEQRHHRAEEAARRLEVELQWVKTEPAWSREPVRQPEPRISLGLLVGGATMLLGLALLLLFAVPWDMFPSLQSPSARPEVQDQAAEEARRTAQEELRRMAEEEARRAETAKLEEERQMAEELRKQQEQQEWEALKARLRDRGEVAPEDPTAQPEPDTQSAGQVVYYEDSWDAGAAAASASEWARQRSAEEEAAREREKVRIDATRAEMERAVQEHNRRMDREYGRR